MGEMQKTSNDYCYPCKYYSGAKKDASKRVCMYYLKTGKRRGCNVGECDKFEKRSGRKCKNYLEDIYPQKKKSRK